MKLDGKTVLITGGASGIGKATVLEFARCGARVICADINETKAAEVAKEAAAGGTAAEVVALDMADAKSVRRAAADVIARHQRVDVLVNAAGYGDIQPFIDNAPDYM
ncbi:MAG: SDR family NAD(P)-dependent oxidoreductase, partial [Xanthobacteraceae bacterium]